jgi:glycosyltransferase involved in cell wall biosynthesis
MKFRYIISSPFSVNPGGTSEITKNIINKIKQTGHDISALDYMAEEIDFDTLLIFSFSYHNPDIIEAYKKKGIKIVLFPVFDRTKPRAFFKLYKIADLFGLQTIFKIRQRLLNAADLVIVAAQDEATDINGIFGTEKSKIKLIHYALADNFFEVAKTVSADLFYKAYGWKDFVFCPAAAINDGKRKNQMTLLKSLKGSGIKLVLTGCDSIYDNIKQEFEDLTKNDPDILCLPRISFEMLISAYKCAKLAVSVSLAETAGLVNLEAAYLGCNLVVSDLPALREYLEKWAIYVNPRDKQDILKGIQNSINLEYDPKVKSFIEENYTWDSYVDQLESLLG